MADVGIQCYLEGIGWILWTGQNSGKPVPRISRFDIESTSPAITSRPDENKRKHWYKWNEAADCWDLTYEEASTS